MVVAKGRDGLEEVQGGVAMVRPKDKGTRFETALVRWLLGHRFRAVRRVLHGNRDEGDVGAVINGLPVTIEAKDRKRIELLKWFEEAEAEAANGGGEAMLVIHRPGCGTATFGRNLAVMTLDTMGRRVFGRYSSCYANHIDYHLSTPSIEILFFCFCNL